jgi:glycosyltransferase involved in cell wall biosynthesis
MLHVVPGETILELGAGSGLLTERLDSLLQGENSLTSIGSDAASLPATSAVPSMLLSFTMMISLTKPNGVGLALKDGFRAATGRYILSMDCDFVEILPQLRSLFRAVAEGHDGAIGNRFSHESILVNYPFAKLLINRLCHLLIKLFLINSARHLSNNLKLYRSEILKGLEISSRHFSANLETGLKPLLAGYDIVELPISWINRTSAMGSSTFNLRRVGFGYVRTLLACCTDNHKQARGFIPLAWRRMLKAFQSRCAKRS